MTQNERKQKEKLNELANIIYEEKSKFVEYYQNEHAVRATPKFKREIESAMQAVVSRCLAEHGIFIDAENIRYWDI